MRELMMTFLLALRRNSDIPLAFHVSADCSPVAVKPVEIGLVCVKLAKLVEVELEELLPTCRIVLHVVTLSLYE